MNTIHPPTVDKLFEHFDKLRRIGQGNRVVVLHRPDGPLMLEYVELCEFVPDGEGGGRVVPEQPDDETSYPAIGLGA